MVVIGVSSITIAGISPIAITWIATIIVWVSSISVTRIASVIVWSICWSCWTSAVVIGISTIVVRISAIVWITAIVIWISTIIISIIVISISTISSILLVQLVTSVSGWSYACFIRIKFLLSIEGILSIR